MKKYWYTVISPQSTSVCITVIRECCYWSNWVCKMRLVTTELTQRHSSTCVICVQNNGRRNNKYYDIIKWRHVSRYWPFLGKPPVTGRFPLQRTVSWSFDIFFYLHMNKRLNSRDTNCLKRHRVSIMILYTCKRQRFRTVRCGWQRHEEDWLLVYKDTKDQIKRSVYTYINR